MDSVIQSRRDHEKRSEISSSSRRSGPPHRNPINYSVTDASRPQLVDTPVSCWLCLGDRERGKPHLYQHDILAESGLVFPVKLGRCRFVIKAAAESTARSSVGGLISEKGRRLPRESWRPWVFCVYIWLFQLFVGNPIRVVRYVSYAGYLGSSLKRWDVFGQCVRLRRLRRLSAGPMWFSGVGGQVFC